MTELTKLITEKGNLQEAFQEYFSKVLDEILELKTSDIVIQNVISEHKKDDFFWAASNALETISIKNRGVAFANDEDNSICPCVLKYFSLNEEEYEFNFDEIDILLDFLNENFSNSKDGESFYTRNSIYLVDFKGEILITKEANSIIEFLCGIDGSLDYWRKYDVCIFEFSDYTDAHLFALDLLDGQSDKVSTDNTPFELLNRILPYFNTDFIRKNELKKTFVEYALSLLDTHEDSKIKVIEHLLLSQPNVK